MMFLFFVVDGSKLAAFEVFKDFCFHIENDLFSDVLGLVAHPFQFPDDRQDVKRFGQAAGIGPDHLGNRVGRVIIDGIQHIVTFKDAAGQYRVLFFKCRAGIRQDINRLVVHPDQRSALHGGQVKVYR